MKRYIMSAVHQLSGENNYERSVSLQELPLSGRDLSAVLNDPNWKVRATLARNPNISVDALRALAEDKNTHVRAYLASNPNLPVDLFQHCAEDRSAEVRKAVADNPNTPVELLEKLSTDKESFVRSGVATNPNTPVDLLCKLANVRASRVPHSLATNPNLPEDLRAKIVQANPDITTDYDFHLRSGSLPDDVCAEFRTQAEQVLSEFGYSLVSCAPSSDGVNVETSWIPLYDEKMGVMGDLDDILSGLGYAVHWGICDHRYSWGHG